MGRKVGVALSAGGARGLAHIGVLQVLEREKIPIDFIAGTSMGAVIAAAYAAGTDPDFMAKLALNLNNVLFADVTIPRLRLLKGDKVMEMIRLLTRQKNFNEMKIPLAIVAVDIERGEKVVFREGPVAEAVRASISIPGVFQPFRMGERLLVDGAVLEKVPVSVLREMGADYIIAVDVKFWTPEAGEKIKISNIYEVIMQSLDLIQNEASKNQLQEAEVVVNPKLKKVSAADFGKAEEIILMGKTAMEEQIRTVLHDLKSNDRQAL